MQEGKSLSRQVSQLVHEFELCDNDTAPPHVNIINLSKPLLFFDELFMNTRVNLSKLMICKISIRRQLVFSNALRQTPALFLDTDGLMNIRRPRSRRSYAF